MVLVDNLFKYFHIIWISNTLWVFTQSQRTYVDQLDQLSSASSSYPWTSFWRTRKIVVEKLNITSRLVEEVCQEIRWILASGMKLCPLNIRNTLINFQGTRYLPAGRADWRYHIFISWASQNETLVDFVQNSEALIRQDCFGTVYRSDALHSFRSWVVIRG